MDRILSGASVEVAEVCRAARLMVLDCRPEAFELVWERQRIVSYGFGPKKMSEHYVYIAPFKGHVNLGFYYGGTIGDARLIGGGKEMRHVKLRGVEDVEQWREVVLAAIEERRGFLAL